MNRPLITLADGESFAVEDVKSQTERVIDIILANNRLSKKKSNALLDLRESVLANSQVEPLRSTSHDCTHWRLIMKIDDGHCWFDDFHHGLVISYFHRIILDKLNYFESKSDPYQGVKQRALINFLNKDRVLERGRRLELKQILMGMLWGNKVDFVPPVVSQEKTLLVDERQCLIDFLIQRRPSRLDIIADNGGEELFYDILFIHYLFSHDMVKNIRYHVKNYPYNVSDVTKEDVFWAINFLNKTGDEHFRTIAKNILNLISEEKVQIITYPFTTLGFDRRKAMNVVREQYVGSSLLITKGDFNYRKNVGWRYWKVSDSCEEVISYLQCPLVCFRTIKNEILLGINDHPSINLLDKEDPCWWKKGRGAAIMFLAPKNHDSLERGEIKDYWAKSL